MKNIRIKKTAAGDRGSNPRVDPKKKKTAIFDFHKEYYINQLAEVLRQHADNSYVFGLHYHVQKRLKKDPSELSG